MGARRDLARFPAALGRRLLQQAGEGELDCSAEVAASCLDPSAARSWAIGALFLILFSSAVGVLSPLLSRRIPALRPGSFPFTAARCFGGGVVLATGFIHVFPEGIDLLANPCLGWVDYPWGAMFATAAAILVAIVEFAAGQILFATAHSRISKQISDATSEASGPLDPELAPVAALEDDPSGGELAKGPPSVASSDEAQVWARCRAVAVAQVLEYGIAIHSVIIGLALGVSSSPCTIRPLAAALVFHQMFEGIALGATLIGAGYDGLKYVVMAAIFALTTPFGIALGIGIRTTYNENSSTALAVNGVLESVAAGILIYMALVDLIATDVFGSHMRTQRVWFQAGCLLSLFAGAVGMAILAIWA